MSGRYGRLIVIGLVLIGVSVIGNAVLYAMGVSPFNGVKIDEEHTVSAVSITEIVMFSNAGDVRVVTGGDEIAVKMTGKTERLRRDDFHLSVEQQGSRVVIEATRDLKRKLFSIYPGDYELLVEIPERLYDMLEISTESADISAAGVRANHILIQSGYGEIRTTGVAGSISARTDAGDIRLGVRAIADNVLAETTFGDIEVAFDEKPEALALDLKTSLGEHKVDLPGTAIHPAGADVPTVRLTAGVGDIAVTVAGR
jgi:hypothetical protein